jgi:peroxiredoxin
MQTYNSLPEGLPVPTDDGAAAHLFGFKLPSILLESTDGSSVDPSKLAGRAVLYAYPKTGVPGQPLPENWDAIPGARGCTPETCAFRDHFAELKAAGAHAVYGISTQSTDYQRELRDRLHLPFAILSDEKLDLTDALQLPTFDVSGETLLKRITRWRDRACVLSDLPA